MSTHKPPHLDLLNNQSNNENIPTTSLIGGESSSGGGSVAGKHHSYKTLLCHQWLTNGTCPRGPDCDYAHGTSEIRQRAGEGSGTLYKREMCKFWMTGKCAHGNMCNYAHGQTELRESNQQQTQKPPMVQQPLTPATSSMVGGRAPYFSFHSPPTPKLMPQQLHHYHQNIVANKIPPLSSSAPHFLMSNPPPPQPLTPLWGQMPIQSSPTVLNTLLLTPGHFQPLTGGGIHLRSLPAPPHFPPPPHSSPAYSHHHHPLPIAAAANQSQPPHQLFANVNASVPHNNQQMMPSQPPPMMMMPRPAHTQSPMTMAELAMQFEIMNMPNPPIAPAKDPDFDANNEVDFPTLESTVKKGPSAQSKAEKLVERAIAVEQKSFANIAAKPPEAIIAKHNKQPLPPPPQKLMPAQPAPAVVNRAVTRPIKTVEKQMSIPEEEEEADEAAEAAFLTNNHHLLLVPMPISPPPGFPKKFATSSPPQLLEQSSSSNEDSYSNDNNNILWGIDDNDEPPTAEEEEDTTAPMQMQSHLEDLWNQDPYLSHVMQTEAEMIKSIERKEEEPQENGVSCEWSTVVSRRRKSSLNAEHLAHRPSPCTDDGYQEDYSDNDDVDGNNGGGQRTIESPASSIAQHGEANGGSSGSRNHLDKSHVFYRTHICNFWQAWRDKKGPPCKHGAGCFYAHGPSKLIELNRKYYKTVLCDTYNSGKDCPFGRSCNFAHGEKELRRFNEAPNANTKEQKKFYTVPKRHQMRKQRGTQTIQCIPTAAKHFDKVTVVKAGESSSANNKK